MSSSEVPYWNYCDPQDSDGGTLKFNISCSLINNCQALNQGALKAKPACAVQYLFIIFMHFFSFFFMFNELAKNHTSHIFISLALISQTGIRSLKSKVFLCFGIKFGGYTWFMFFLSQIVKECTSQKKNEREREWGRIEKCLFQTQLRWRVPIPIRFVRFHSAVSKQNQR